jgi:hypothetical protein
MAVNKINPLEQHVEKIVLGLAAAGLLGVLVYQFVGPKTLVDAPKATGKGKEKVPVTEAFARIENEAKKLRADMEGSGSPPDPRALPDTGGIAKAFEARFAGPVSNIATLPFGGGTAMAEATNPDTPRVGPLDAPVNVPRIPAPKSLVGFAFLSTVSEAEVAAAPALAKLLPKTPPFDLAGVSLEATIDGPALRAAFEVDPDGPGPIRALPPIWWENNSAIMEIEVTRQERTPAGTWGPEQVLPPMPGRFSLTGPLHSGTSGGNDAYQNLIADALDNEEELLRPQWYKRPELNGHPVGSEWLLPSEAILASAAADDKSAEAQRVQREIDGLYRQLTNVERALESARRQPNPPAGPGGSRGPSTGGRPSPNQPPNTNENTQVARLERQRTKILEDIAARETRLKDLGSRVKAREPSAAQGQPMFTDPALRVLAHDPTVQPGRTYRYKLRYGVSNPIYSRIGVPQEQAEAVKQRVLWSAPTDWTDPLTIDETTLFFITTAAGPEDKAGALARGARATAELYAFAWGYWHKASISLEPGDALSATAKVPDFAKLLADSAAAAPNPGGPSAPPAPPSSPVVPGRRPIGTEPPPPPPPGGGSRPDPAKPAEVPKVDMAISRDAWLLDVATDAAVSRERVFQAYLRDSSGAIISRRPDADRSDRRLSRIANSGRELDALLANRNNPVGKPGEAPTPPPGRPRPGEREPLPPPPPPPGGGGGGGGGGG